MKRLAETLIVLSIAGGFLGAAFVLMVSRARADDDDAPILELNVEPWNERDGVDRPFRYMVSLRPGSGASAAEGSLRYVADRRLLWFEVRPAEGRARRLRRCRHPHAPRRVASARARDLTGESAQEWREWVDLRMYCWGANFRALTAAPVEVIPHYGFRRGTSRAWVVERTWTETRRGRERQRTERTASVEAAGFNPTFPQPSAGTRRLDTSEGETSPIELALTPTSARRGSALTFSVGIRASATEQRARVYTRPDSFSFRVRGPLGEVTCRIPASGGTPPADLFRTITERRRVRHRLEASYFCPAGTFQLAGVYEVVPKVRLRHSGGESGVDGVTGRFVGAASFVRVTQGERPYLEQVWEPPQ